MQRKLTSDLGHLDSLAAGSSRIKQGAKLNGTQTGGGGFSGKTTKLSGYTTLFGTREQSFYASSQVQFVEGIPPLGPIHSKRGK